MSDEFVSADADLVDASPIWHVIDAYDMQSRMPQCSITGTQKRDSDLGVFRPSTELSYIDQEGSYDISQLVIEEAARLLGWAPRTEVEAEIANLTKKLNEANSRLGNSARKIKRLEARLEELESAE